MRMCSKREISRLTWVLAFAAGLGQAQAADITKVRGAGVRGGGSAAADRDGGGGDVGRQVPGAGGQAAGVQGGTAAAGGTGQSRETVAVMIDHAKVIRLPERTQTVIVGNPIIADVTVQRNGILVVTGKSYGVTNLIALDGGGAMLAESLVSVQAPQDSVVMVQRGFDRESYSCTPHCQPSILLGDSAKYFGEVGSQATQRNSLATQR